MNKDVLNKLAKIESKVELAEVKVDLSLINDFAALYEKMQQELDSAFAIQTQGKNLIRQSIQKEKNAQTFGNNAIKIGNDILTQMKELGIQDPTINNRIKSFESDIAESQDRLKSIEKAVTSF